MSGPFSPPDFPHSEFINGGLSRDSDVYPQWAAEAANRVWTRTLEGAEFEAMLDEVAVSRAALESRLNRTERPDLQFGLRRKRWMYTVFGNWGNLQFGSPETGPVRAEVLRRVVHRPYPIEATILGRRVWAREIRAELADGSRITASRVFEGMEKDWFGNVGVEHSSVEACEALLSDLPRFLVADAGLGHAARALWAFYQAMPFERGSASIGRSFWAGWLSARAGRRVRVPDGVDLFAMTEECEAFVTWLVPRLF